MSCSVTDPRLAFHATYFDVASHTTKEYLCLFYHGDSTVELIDATHGKTFLKRTSCPNLTKPQFFIGANIVVFGRVLTLTRYADKVTEQLSEKTSEAAIVVVSEPLFRTIGDCLDVVVQECCFSVCSMAVTELRTADWDGPASFLPRSFAGQRAMVLHLVRDKALIKAADLPSRFGSPKHVWVSASKADVENAQDLATLADRRPAVDFNSTSSVVLIKPHVLQEKRGGEAIQKLLKALPNMKLVNASQLTLSGSQADAFFQPYKGVLKEYRPSVEQLATSACWAIQLVAAAADRDENVVDQVRAAVGPFDPVIAKLLRPKTLRAMFGVDSARNGLHCSDLPEDGAVDAQFLWGRR